jgi:hypothetical protein
MPYVPVFKPGTHELLFCYDPQRRIIEIQERRVKYYIDLAIYEAAPRSAERFTDGRVQDHVDIHGAAVGYDPA